MGREYPRHPVPAVAAVVIRDDAVLLVRRANPPSQGEWSLPGGVLEVGESLKSGLVREVKEETGLQVEPIAIIEVLDHILRDDNGDGTNAGTLGRVRFHYVLIDFVCRVKMGNLSSAGDALEAQWVAQRDLAENTVWKLAAKTLEVIEKGFRLSKIAETEEMADVLKQ